MRRALAVVAVSLALTSVAPAAPDRADSTSAQLLARHAPVLRLHPNERLSPVPADGFLTDSDLQVRAPDGTWQVSKIPLPQAGPAARLDQRLCRAVDGPAALDCYVAGERAHAAAPTVYGAVFRTRDRIALQYWLFYPVNTFSISSPKGIFWQSHEGDWEAVTVLLDRRERPALVGLSEHCAGARREWNRTERRGSRPVVYVALGSHANYFTPGNKPLVRSCWPSQAVALADAYKVPLFDRAARGQTVVPTVSRVVAATPSWLAFAGTWGEDQYVSLPNIAPLPYGTGPRGPAYHRLWRQPIATVLAWPVAR